MANSKYEYVKSFEVEDKLMPMTWMVVEIDGRNFKRFCEEHKFQQPNDILALHLMNSCAVALLNEFTDIIFSYGFSDKYSFVFKKTSQFYQRRASKIVSICVSFFTSVYVMKWKELFPEKELKSTPSFDGHAKSYPSTKILRDDLALRQSDCHVNNQYNTYLWMLVKSGKTETEVQDILKENNTVLFHQFVINYKAEPVIFRKGSCVFNDKVEEIVKYDEGGNPVKRSRKKVVVSYCDIIEDNFWREHPNLLLD